RCLFCGKCWEYPNQLKAHLFVKHQQPNNSTKIKNIPMNDDLPKTAKGFKCTHCGKVFLRKYGLKIHMRTHTGFKPLKCRFCGRAFSDPSNLNKHTRLHAEMRAPYTCEECGKLFVRRRDLQRHVKSKHSNVTIFKCTHCGTIFFKKVRFNDSNKNAHALQPVKVSLLWTSVSDPSNLNKHTRLHAEECGKLFVRRRDLQRHVKFSHSSVSSK
ncbi:hypothetical protein HELRODRAFT_87582, partial [Helobdella robusta]|uniref:C2H2-type domain-containing protein n=1 Tax=Helobdella robusta TaxID=6412 RepID=T1G6S5_HELRO